MKKRVGIAIAAAALIALPIGIRTFSFGVNAAEPITAPEGVSIEGRDVSGMTLSEIQQVVDDYLSNYDDTVFTLTAEDKSIEVNGSELGFSALNPEVAYQALEFGSNGNILERLEAKHMLTAGEGKDFSIAMSCDIAAVRSYLSEHAAELEQEATNSTLKRENGGFTIVGGSDGVTVKVDESAAAVVEYVTESYKGGSAEIALVTDVVKPEGDEETLSKIKDVLGTFHTDFSSSSSARANNVRNGASKINGATVYPGEEFSVATALNPMTAENGYQPAPSYENGTTVETYGGGICQVSTTLYNAVMRAELDIVTRSCHSMVVSYVKPSMDAAIAGTTKDFVFRNNQDYPVYIEGYTDGGVIYFTVWGVETRDPGRTVEFESEVLSQTDPINEYTADASLPVGTITKTSGSAHTGYTARLWKIVYQDGTEVSRTIYNNSSYRVTNNTFSVGTASGNPDATNAMNAAIATQDQATIEGTAASWNDAALAAAAQAAADAEKAKEDKKDETKDDKKDETKEDKKDETKEEKTEDKTEDTTDSSSDENPPEAGDGGSGE